MKKTKMDNIKAVMMGETTEKEKKKNTAWSSQNKNKCRKCGYVKCQCKKK